MRVQSILFVCTGNTCRSPMAQAIAAHLICQAGIEVQIAESEVQQIRKGGVRIASAGVGAAGGMPMSPEARIALKSLGIESPQRSSRMLSADLVQDADVIYTMTSSHIAGVTRVWRPAKGKTFLLDPSGEEIPDPVGMGQRVYTQTAQRLIEVIRLRLTELGLEPGPVDA